MATYRVKVDDKQYEVTVTDAPDGGADVRVEGRRFRVEPADALPAASQSPTPARASGNVAPTAKPMPRVGSTTPVSSGASGAIQAPIPGVVTKVLVAVGDDVAAGQVVLKLEAMKMENDINTPVAGTIKQIAVAEGAEVRDGQLLVVVE